MIKRKINIVTVSILYIILVSLIPLVSGFGKGSLINTIAKFLIFLGFALTIFYRSSFKSSFTFFNGYIFIVYVLSQLLCLFVWGTINLIAAIAQSCLLFLIFIQMDNIGETDDNILAGIKIFFLFNLAAIFYNILENFSNILNLSFITDIHYDMYSFFDNKNTYGMMLFVGFVLLFYYKSIKKDCNNFKFYLFLFVQCIAILMSLCRTALLCSGVFFILFWLRKLSVKRVILFCLFLISTIILFNFETARQFILYHILRIDVGTYREGIYDGAKELICNSILFGYGEDSFADKLFQISENVYAHNGFFTVLLNGGLIYLSGYIVAYIIMFKLAVKISSLNKEFGYNIVAFLISTVVYAFFEGVIICGSSSTNFALCICSYVIPLLYFNYREKVGEK